METTGLRCYTVMDASGHVESQSPRSNLLYRGEALIASRGVVPIKLDAWFADAKEADARASRPRCVNQIMGTYSGIYGFHAGRQGAAFLNRLVCRGVADRFR